MHLTLIHVKKIKLQSHPRNRNYLQEDFRSKSAFDDCFVDLDIPGIEITCDRISEALDRETHP